MPSVADAIVAVEVLGGRFWLDHDEVRYRAPHTAAARIRPHLELLRQQRNRVVELLRQRDIPPMPSGVRLIHWSPKPPPVAIQRCSVVNDVHLFARTTLRQLEFAMAGNNWLAGNWSVRELVDRLEAVGVVVELQTVQSSG